jgi:hypothetical protein
MDLLAPDSHVGFPLAQLLQNFSLTNSGLSLWANHDGKVHGIDATK